LGDIYILLFNKWVLCFCVTGLDTVAQVHLSTKIPSDNAGMSNEKSRGTFA